VAANISKVLNANWYLDGTNDQIGRTSEIEMPSLAWKMIDHTALGMIGTVELPTGLDKLTMKLKWAGFYSDVMALIANPFKSHRFHVRASVQSFGPEGKTSDTPLVMLVTGSSKQMQLGTLKPMESTDVEDELAVTYLKLTVGGKDILELDVWTNTFKVDGKDVLAQFRANQGGN